MQQIRPPSSPQPPHRRTARIVLHVADDLGDLPADPVGRKIAQARQRKKLEPVGGGELCVVGRFFTPVSGGVLLSSVEPDADWWLAARERYSGVSARPMSHLGDEGFLHTVGEQGAEPADLRDLHIGDEDGLVAALQQRATRAVQPTGFLRQVGVDEHMKAASWWASARAEQVEVVGEADEGVQLDVVTLGGARKNANEDLPQADCGPQQEAPLDGPGGDLHERSIWEIAQSSPHAHLNGVERRALAEWGRTANSGAVHISESASP